MIAVAIPLGSVFFSKNRFYSQDNIVSYVADTKSSVTAKQLTRDISKARLRGMEETRMQEQNRCSVRNRLHIVAVLLTMFMISAAIVSAQTSRGTVSGTVTDPNGAVIADTAVMLTNLGTGVSWMTVTNEEGFYRFEAV